MSDNEIYKIEILIQQKRYTEAEKILKTLLARDSNNALFLSLLAEVKLQQEKADDAEELINSAIGIAPDSSHLFFIKSRISLQQDNFDDGEKYISQAVQMDPYNADYYALYANIKLSRKQFQEALELADKALEIDAENVFGLNARSKALLKLNKKDDSFKTIEGALREDPNNPYTHANYGWGLLEKGDYKKAKQHFGEALKNDPSFEFAQAGMVQALKATNPVYRLFLKYAFFMGNLTAKYQWGVIIGFYLVMRLLKTVAEKNEALQPYLDPILIIFALIAFSTWVISPVSNLFLRFNKYGQFLLDKKEKLSSNFVAISFVLFVVGLLLFIFMDDYVYLTIAVYGFVMMLPLSIMFSPTKYKNALLIYTIVLAALGLLSISVSFSTGNIFNGMSMIFIFGFVAFQWVANFMVIKQSNR